MVKGGQLLWRQIGQRVATRAANAVQAAGNWVHERRTRRARIDRLLEAQLSPDHGGSLCDRIVAIDQRTLAHTGKIAALQEAVDALDDRLEEHITDHAQR